MLNMQSTMEIVPSYGTEIKRILRLFWPVILGQLAQTSMGVVDTLMAGAAGTVQLSGVAIGGSFLWPALLFLIGLIAAITPIISQLRGRNTIEDIPKRMHLASVICFIAAIIIGILIAISPYIYYLIDGINPEMIEVATGYLFAVALGMPGFALYNLLRAYSEGLGNTYPTLIFGFVALIFNIPLNYIFIFGKFGVPELGGVGCGVATSLSMYFAAFLMLIYIKRAKFYEKYRIYTKRYDFSFAEVKSFIKLGMPLALANTIEVACFSLVSFLLSPFGPEMVAGHTIAMNVSGLIFMFPMCIGIVATIRVGEAMGLHHWNRALRTTKSSYIIGYLIYIAFFLLVFFNKEFIVNLYSQDTNVMPIAITLLNFLLAYLLWDFTQVIAIGVLRGFKDTKTIFYITTFSYWVIGMPIGVILAYGLHGGEQWAAKGFWLSFILSLGTASICYIIRMIYLYKKRILPKGMHLSI